MAVLYVVGAHWMRGDFQQPLLSSCFHKNWRMICRALAQNGDFYPKYLYPKTMAVVGINDMIATEWIWVHPS